MEVRKVQGEIQEGPNKDEFFLSDELPILTVHKRTGSKVSSVAGVHYQKPWKVEPDVDESKYVIEENAELEVYSVKGGGIYLPFLRDRKLGYSDKDYIDESNYYIVYGNNKPHLVKIVDIEDYEAEYGMILPEESDKIKYMFEWDEDIEYKGRKKGIQVFKL